MVTNTSGNDKPPKKPDPKRSRRPIRLNIKHIEQAEVIKRRKIQQALNTDQERHEKAKKALIDDRNKESLFVLSERQRELQSTAEFQSAANRVKQKNHLMSSLGGQETKGKKHIDNPETLDETSA